MHFCSECHNMYYVKIKDNDENTLIYYCRNCGHQDDILTAENICVLETQIKKSAQKYTHAINRYTKLDPTLPHTTTIRCPNQDCPSNVDETKRDVLYIRYNDIDMKYIYVCSVCDTTWKTDEQR